MNIHWHVEIQDAFLIGFLMIAVLVVVVSLILLSLCILAGTFTLVILRETTTDKSINYKSIASIILNVLLLLAKLAEFILELTKL